MQSNTQNDIAADNTVPEHEVNNVHSYGYSQYAQPHAQPASTTTNMSAAVDPFGDPEKTRAVSSSSSDSNSSTGLHVKESSDNVGNDDESAAMALLTLKKP